MREHIQWLGDIGGVSAAAWNALLDDDHPFVRHEFLHALEASGSLRPELGWHPQHLLLWHDGQLVAAAPCYVKTNSHGEFVFDWNWAEAWQRAGHDYYPKLLCAVPYSPVTGPRLLAVGADAPTLRAKLLAAMQARCRDEGWSGAHINFLAGDEDAAPSLQRDWLARFDWQFHWQHRGYAGFDDFLGALSAKKRKNIRQERARFRAPAWKIERVGGDAIDAAMMDDIYRFYACTFQMKGNVPALTRAFFERLRATMPEALLAVVGYRDGERVGAAFCLQGAGSLYGRYWGCSEDVPGLHFECCYYQGIEHCIERGLSRFEPGAQGEHKIARGFLPVRTHSRHFLVDAGFRTAIADYLRREAVQQQRYGEMLTMHSPYREKDVGAA
jgi:predicted N-acyltransferase